MTEQQLTERCMRQIAYSLLESIYRSDYEDAIENCRDLDLLARKMMQDQRTLPETYGG